jgi:hypothetical protein
MITWITAAGSLGILTERITVNIPVEATSTVGAVSYSIIAGSLPRGLRLLNDSIVGAPVEVKVYTTSKFVVRASDGVDIEDRTFTIDVDGSDTPMWLTREGFLNVGPAKAYFVLDNARVDFQLEATDTDLTAGDVLEFYLVPNGGLLPPGLSLSRDGVISGFTDPIFALEYLSDPFGGYDTTPMDVVPLDFAEAKSNGFDTFFYDTQTFDYNEPSRVPRRLSRIYTFVVAVTDGIYTENRLFKIYVVTEEFLQADNSIVQVDTNLFQADSNSNRSPLWVTESNLGRIRANNYVTIFLDVYNPPTLTGTITYFLLATNSGTYRLKETGQTSSGNYEISNILPSFKYIIRGDWNNLLNYKVGDAVIFRDNEDSTIRDRVWICISANKNVFPTENLFWTKQNVTTSTQTYQLSNTNLWETINPETISELPPGMELDTVTGNIAGRIPYQARISKTYTFSMRAVNFPAALAYAKYILQGEWNPLTDYRINDAVLFNGLIYICILAHRYKLPTDIEFWIAGTTFSDKTFSVEIIGEIDSAIRWLTDSDLGTIKPNQSSILQVEAEALLFNSQIRYEWVDGHLPPGLTFLPTGLIQGKSVQFGNISFRGFWKPNTFYETNDIVEIVEINLLYRATSNHTSDLTFNSTNWNIYSFDNNESGLTRFFDAGISKTFNTTFDNELTSFDKKFTFTIKARDNANFAVINKTFHLTVVSDTVKIYSNIYIKAFQTKENRLIWYDFITNSTIFKPNEMYRYGDPNFGVQPSLKILIFAGIESQEAVKYVQAMSRNHYRKRIKFGDVKMAVAKDLTNQNSIYEIIYIDMIDDYEKNGKSISETVNLPNNINSKVLISYDSIKIDSDIPLVSDSDHQRIFPNSIKNMRERIRSIGDNDREYLPLWMRSIQDSGIYETGYVKALPICYCKPGTAINIMARIKAANFDFKSLDFVADRYIIDIIDGQVEDKYLAFPQRGEKLP